MPFADPKRAREYNRVYQRAWMKAKAARWRANGCCSRCGLPVEKFKHCRECRAKLNRHYWRKVRATLFTRRCPVHPNTPITRFAKGCQVCAREKAWAAKRAKNRTIGPLAALLRTETLNIPQISARLGVSKPSVVKALRRLMLKQIGLECYRRGRGVFYRMREAA